MPETYRDASADTARFQAFKNRNDDLPPVWEMKAPGLKIGMLAVIVLLVALAAALFGVLLTIL
jgi:hypothetical protein